ncbi:hypothetical protein, partial [Leptolyngbya sp. PCC 6406]|uniref:hypothetical protein n=1 Tax=Leptolyngbya sp. PCC 6406 TaxID=1173264 RepID=UPI0021F1B17C
GLGKNRGLTNPVLDSPHHSIKGTTTDNPISDQLRCWGIASAIRQKILGFRLGEVGFSELRAFDSMGGEGVME